MIAANEAASMLAGVADELGAMYMVLGPVAEHGAHIGIAAAAGILRNGPAIADAVTELEKISNEAGRT